MPSVRPLILCAGEAPYLAGVSTPLSIAVIGIGGIGSTFAYYLARAGHDVTVVARPGSPRLQQLQREGGIVRDTGGARRGPGGGRARPGGGLRSGRRHGARPPGGRRPPCARPQQGDARCSSCSTCSTRSGCATPGDRALQLRHALRAGHRRRRREAARQDRAGSEDAPRRPALAGGVRTSGAAVGLRPGHAAMAALSRPGVHLVREHLGGRRAARARRLVGGGDDRGARNARRLRGHRGAGTAPLPGRQGAHGRLPHVRPRRRCCGRCRGSPRSASCWRRG